MMYTHFKILRELIEGGLKRDSQGIKGTMIVQGLGVSKSGALLILPALEKHMGEP